MKSVYGLYSISQWNILFITVYLKILLLFVSRWIVLQILPWRMYLNVILAGEAGTVTSKRKNWFMHLLSVSGMDFADAILQCCTISYRVVIQPLA